MIPLVSPVLIEMYNLVEGKEQPINIFNNQTGGLHRAIVLSDYNFLELR